MVLLPSVMILLCTLCVCMCSIDVCGDYVCVYVCVWLSNDITNHYQVSWALLGYSEECCDVGYI